MRGRLIFAFFAAWTTCAAAQSDPPPDANPPRPSVRPLPLKAPAHPLLVVVRAPSRTAGC